MGIQKFPDPKDGGDDLDFVLNWVDIIPTADSIASSTWTIPAGLTSHDETFTAKTTTVWLTGGTEGTQYQLTNVIVTDSVPPRTFERDVILKVKNL